MTRSRQKAAVMQPYVFPYLGYFQMIYASDIFVFYDDVNFIKRGWINRNRIAMNDTDLLITFPVKKASQNKLICDIERGEPKAYKKVLKTVETAYSKAPFFSEVYPLLERVVLADTPDIARFAATSVIEICHYLGLQRDFRYSSQEFGNTKGLDKADRLIEICHLLDVKDYINAIGGRDLYNKEYFQDRGINLMFIEPNIEEYPQSTSSFLPGLSMIDVLMNNSKEKTVELLSNYKLI